MAKIAIMGYGTVGSGVYEVVKKNTESISRKSGQAVDIKYILDLRDFPEHDEQHLFIKDFNIILNDPEINVVVEVMGGTNPAYSFTKAALLNKKHVVTSNKELVAKHGTELLKIAMDNNVSYLFEASVGGGIPIIRPLYQCLAANEITEIMGILNGTTNYILTQMIKEGKSFETALTDAQQKGYAEANPAADVEGHDACRKIAILSSLAFGRFTDFEKIYTEGITKLTLTDVKYAEELGCVIKLIAYCKKTGDKVYARVSPMLLPKSHSLAGVDDVFNGILVKGDAIGDVMFYGRGAGKLPTASAVVADVIDAVSNIERNKPVIWYDLGSDFVADINEDSCAFFVRIVDKDGTKDKIKSSFGEVSFVYNDLADNEFAFITQVINEGSLKQRLSDLEGIIQIIRMQPIDG